MIDIRRFEVVAVVQAALDGLDVLASARCLAVVASLLLVWVTLEPFEDLRIATLPGAPAGKLAFTYLAFGALALLTVLLSASDNIPALKSLWTPLHLCLLGWMAFNIALSQSPGVSLQRFVLTASVISLALMIPLLPPTQAAFKWCFAVAALLLLALCYFGLVAAPALAIHSAADVTEPDLAGDWRGSFAHKNAAAAVMAILVYLGLYLATNGLRLWGGSIAALAALFLVGSGGKSALALCIGVGLLAQLIATIRSLWLKMLVCLVPVVLMNLLSVGSAINTGLAAIVGLLPIDTSFTGRTDIWKYAFAAFLDHPFRGYGYAAFWENANRTSAEDLGWASTSPHSHNSYLDLALTIGLPGLVLVILVFVVAPLRNFHVIQSADRSSGLARLFLVIWMFGVYFATMETFLLDRQNPTWFSFVIAAAGLHYLARFGVKA
ncbi:O-antigen ligase family protein [Rhodopseudomonas palustris]|uniref:O-antigen polymerase n=1 Tax=Rhodopseudomonas palustris (strain BisB18) TaxID=316056 RepID=Q21BJ9_RHOPB